MECEDVRAEARLVRLGSAVPTLGKSLEAWDRFGRPGRGSRSESEPVAVLSRAYVAAKRAFDLAVSLVLAMPLLITFALLLVLNPVLNPGPLLFVQDRMGLHCRPFRAYKLRTMTVASDEVRGPFDPLETRRITPLGGLLRRTRLDELPQILNILRGEMSLIGPRPDYMAHAEVYLGTVPGYRERHAVLPGITGYAQTELGYVADEEGIRAKVAADLHYVRRASFLFDLWITWRTALVVLRGEGA